MNVLAKRPHESHWQWRSRVIAVRQAERDKAEPIVPREAQRHAEYVDEDVMHVETRTLAATKRRRFKSSLQGLCDRHQITPEQLTAAQQIQHVSESIRRNVSVRCASLEARVDCAGSGSNVLMEHLRQVRMERAFGRWRCSIRVPRAMIVEMIVQDAALKDTARRYNVGWPKALRMLESALDLWTKLLHDASSEIDERDLEIAYARLQRAA